MMTLFALGACEPTRPPLDQLNAAAHGLENARALGAGEFASADLDAAAREYEAAQAARAQGDFDAAAALALQSRADSELAAARARRAQAQHAVDKLERGNAALQEELSRQPADAAEAQP